MLGILMLLMLPFMRKGESVYILKLCFIVGIEQENNRGNNTKF